MHSDDDGSDNEKMADSGEGNEGKAKKKVRFGDEMGRIGRRRKGAGKLFDEEAKRFGETGDDDDDNKTDLKRHRDRNQDDLRSSMKINRELKAIEDAAEDWEHSEDSGEEDYRRRYEEESGIRIEPFNTEMEREEGHFDDAGNYVEDRFKISQRDAWLDEVQDKYAHGLVKRIKKKATQQEEAMEEQVDPLADMKFLYEQLEENETVAKALRRIGAQKNDKSKALFDELTECADRLLASGYHNVFSDNKQAVHVRMLASGAIDNAVEADGADDGRLWEYRIEDENSANLDVKKMTVKELRAFLDSKSVSHEGFVEKDELIAKAKQILSRPTVFGEFESSCPEVYYGQLTRIWKAGPFGTGQMRQWVRQGYFSGPKVVLVRQHNPEGGDEAFVRSDRVDLLEFLA